MNFLNKRFKIGTLISESGCPKETAEKWQTLYSTFKELDPDSVRNGRMNYGWVQTLLCQPSNGLFQKGGQGNGLPDFWFDGDRWGETKAYQLGNLKDFHVAASSFFASNAKVPEHKRLLAENPDKAKAFLFEHSYDKNDYYLLTSTSALKCDFSEIEMIFIEKKTLVDCLTASSNFKQVSIDKLLTKVTNV